LLVLRYAPHRLGAGRDLTVLTILDDPRDRKSGEKAAEMGAVGDTTVVSDTGRDEWIEIVDQNVESQEDPSADRNGSHNRWVEQQQTNLMARKPHEVEPENARNRPRCADQRQG